MPKISEERRQARRDQILDGARRTFARYGYEGATVARLEQEIGLSRGAIFNYFPDKWALFKALAERDQHRFLDVLLEDGLDSVLRMLSAESPDWLGVYFELTRRLRTDPSLMKDFQTRNPELEKRADERFRELQRSGVYRDDVELEAIIGFVNVVANGLALAFSLGLAIPVEPLLKLVHAGIDGKSASAP